MFFKKEAFADTFALITFGLVVGMSVELFIAGLTIEQSLHSRLLSIPVNMIIARPYGIYRDWLMVLRFPGSGSLIGQTLMDIVAFLTFQMPVYAFLVGTSGASFDAVITACMGQLGAMMIMGRPYGIWLQLCRKWFRPADASVAVA